MEQRFTTAVLDDLTHKRLLVVGLSPLEARAEWALVAAAWRDLLVPVYDVLGRSRLPERGIGLSGPAGCGKTFAVAAMVRGFVKAGINRTMNTNFGDLRWCSWPWAVQEARGMSGSGQPDVNRWLTRVTTATMLILDDLGAERTKGVVGEDFAIGLLDLIMDARARHGRATLYTTNLNERELGTMYGSRVYSRLVGLNPLLRVAGGDRRMGPHA